MTITLQDPKTNKLGFRHFFHGTSKALIANKAFTVEQALAATGLDFHVSKTQLGAFTPRDGGKAVFTKKEGLYVTSRDDSGAILGSVGKDFEPFQNRECLQLASDLLDTGEANIKVMGDVKQGAKTFAVLELPSTGLRVAGLDTESMNVYLTLVNAHDGGQSVTGYIGVERAICNNMLSVGLKNAQASFKVRHTKNMRDKLDVMTGREMLGISVAYVAEWETQMLALLEDKYSERRVESFLARLFPMPKSETTMKRNAQGEWVEIAHRGVKVAEANREAVREIYYGEDNLNNVRGTAFGVYNALTEWTQHHVEGRVTLDRPGGEERIKAENRLVRTLEPQGFEPQGFALLAAGAR